jgi:plasmid maintenance system antidote protein VapI
MARRPKTWADQLRWSIVASGLTSYALWKETGVSESVIGRFLRKKRSIQFGTAEKLGRAVGVTLQTGKE